MVDNTLRLRAVLIAAFTLAVGFSGTASAQQAAVVVEREAYTGPAIIVRDLPQPPPSATATEIEAALTRFDWVMRPSGEYPRIAAQIGIERGEAELVCQVSHDGALSACSTVNENPGGVGFAAEAVRAARGARVGPTAFSQSVRFRLVFQTGAPLQVQSSSSF
jgi:hypothetical protein